MGVKKNGVHRLHLVSSVELPPVSLTKIQIFILKLLPLKFIKLQQKMFLHLNTPTDPMHLLILLLSVLRMSLFCRIFPGFSSSYVPILQNLS